MLIGILIALGIVGFSAFFYFSVGRNPIELIPVIKPVDPVYFYDEFIVSYVFSSTDPIKPNVVKGWSTKRNSVVESKPQINPNYHVGEIVKYRYISEIQFTGVEIIL